MRKDFKLLALLFIIAIPYFWLKFRTSSSWKQSLSKPTVINLDKDSSQYKQWYFEFEIDSLIQSKNFATAERRIDSAILANRNAFVLLDLKGELLLHQGKLKHSILLFSEAIKRGGEVPRMLEHRAEAYERLGYYDSAIIDLRKATYWRTDLYKGIAELYEKKNQKDSAVKYYQLYLNENPNSSNIIIRLKQLVNSG